jgi:hypothetical protein
MMRANTPCFANAHSRRVGQRGGEGTGTALAPTRLANDARASDLIRSDNVAAHLADAQSERAATATQSGKS